MILDSSSEVSSSVILWVWIMSFIPLWISCCFGNIIWHFMHPFHHSSRSQHLLCFWSLFSLTISACSFVTFHRRPLPGQQTWIHLWMCICLNVRHERAGRWFRELQRNRTKVAIERRCWRRKRSALINDYVLIQHRHFFLCKTAHFMCLKRAKEEDVGASQLDIHNTNLAVETDKHRDMDRRHGRYTDYTHTLTHTRTHMHAHMPTWCHHHDYTPL